MSEAGVDEPATQGSANGGGQRPFALEPITRSNFAYLYSLAVQSATSAGHAVQSV